jgi:hypothetical protein
VDHVLGFCAQLLEKLGTRRLDKAGVKLIVQLLLLPLDAYNNVLHVLGLAHYPALMAFLEPATQKTVSHHLACCCPARVVMLRASL